MAHVNFVLVPIKALAQGKSRLSALLSDAQRYSLSQAMLRDVLAQLRRAATVDRFGVVTSDHSLLDIARGLGAEAIDEGHPRGLNGAVAIGAEFCLQQGGTTLLVLLSDLPLVTSEDIDLLLCEVTDEPEVLLVTCKEGEGTNALLRTPPLVIPTCFGGPSLNAHQVRAREGNVACRVIEAPRIAFDIDSVEDLKLFASKPTATHTYQALQDLDVLPALGVDPSSG